MHTFILAALAALSGAPASALPTTVAPTVEFADCDATYPGLGMLFILCPHTQLLNFGCIQDALAAHELAWNTLVKPYVDSTCEKTDELDILDFQIKQLQNDIDTLAGNIIQWTPLCDAGDLVVCDFLNGVEANIINLQTQQNNLAVYAVLLKINLDAHKAEAALRLAQINQDYLDAGELCCEWPFGMAQPDLMTEPDLMATPAVTAPIVQCDVQFPGDLPLPALDAGECWDMACVNAARAVYEANWTSDIKPGRDMVCDLQNQADAWNAQAGIWANMAAPLIPLCYSGYVEACREMDLYLQQEQDALDQSEGFQILADTYGSSLNESEQSLTEEFYLTIFSCSYLCN